MRVGQVGYATTQGLGYLAKAFHDNGVVTDPIVFIHTDKSKVTHREWYPEGTPFCNSSELRSDEILDLICNLDVMIFHETPFNWELINDCRDRGVKTVLIPMYEWTPVRWPAKPDAVFCPSLLDVDYLKDQFLEGRCIFAPIPVDNSHWKQRTKADKFLHNAGNIGHREHKGTRQLLEAIPLVESSDFRITIRAQNTRALGSILRDTRVEQDSRVTIQSGEIPYEQLWDDHDVYVAPEKFNGLSLPLQESFAAGMMVMTTNRYPMNTWLPSDPLIPVESVRKARISGNYYEFDECILSPETIAKTIDNWVGKDITEYSLRGKLWGDLYSWTNLQMFWKDNLCNLVEDKPCRSC